MVKNWLIIVFSSLLVLTSATAQKIYHTPWQKTGVILGVSTGLVGSALYIEDRRGPLTVEEISALDRESINSFDRQVIGNYSSQAGLTSDHFKNVAFVAPFSLLLSRQGRENTKEIAYMYAEVLGINSGLTAITKTVIARNRPYTYNPDVDIETKLGLSTRRSFFSGHVSHVASLSFFTATIFDDLYPDSNYKYAIWAGAIAAPAITGVLRVRAGRHFPSDVIVGYGVGALIGYFVPELHKITKDSNVTIIGAEGGLGLTYDF